MNFFSDLRISASGMKAERKRMDIISNNIANINNPQTPGERVFQTQRLITKSGAPKFNNWLAGFRVMPGKGVEVTGIVEDSTPPRMSFEPGNPLADSEGYVAYPGVSMIDEMVRAMSASRSYDANLTAFNETKRMFNRALEIGK
ncbi:MAG: flagellar basal body rod protein FlgC [Candidatus Eremiobacteraeota bacterium]|nr:flagellar basal body rod protein FlgC [Candidatus Eremiobacteraeota bacterium]